MTVRIPTARLVLVLQAPDEVLAWVDSLSPAVRAEVSPDWLARVRATEPGDPWSLSFQMVERSSDSVVGSCGFKGPPDADGMVEVAYGVEATHQGRGFATEAMGALTEFAFACGRVRLVRAHTKADNAASGRVLEKCGYRCVGEVMDPDDGAVLRWERFCPGPISSRKSKGKSKGVRNRFSFLTRSIPGEKQRCQEPFLIPDTFYSRGGEDVASGGHETRE